LIDIGNFINNDVITSSLGINLNSSTAQEIVNWVTTADGCVHTAGVTQLDVGVGSAVCIGLQPQSRRTQDSMIDSCWNLDHGCDAVTLMTTTTSSSSNNRHNRM